MGVFVLIAAGPLLVVALLAWVALRARSRRVEARLPAESRPGAPTHAPPA